MQPRFVVVPAVPIEKDAVKRGSHFYSKIICAGFDIYDNHDKTRLNTSFSTRADAEHECARRNGSMGTPGWVLPLLGSG